GQIAVQNRWRRPWGVLPRVPSWQAGRALLPGRFGLGLGGLREQLLGEVGRHLGVPGELHRELGLALRRAAQRRRVAEHLGERHLGVDPAHALFLGRADHDAAALHDRRQDVARELRRALDRQLHDRLEDLGPGAREEVAERAARGLLERDVARVDRVGLAVVDRDPQADDRHAEPRALADHRLEALLARRDVLARDRAAADLVDELEIAVERLGEAGDPAVLARATGLLLVRVAELDALADRLAIRDLRRRGDDRGLVLALHALDVDLE